MLSWVLAGIYRHAVLAESWIFKGGTCLKKCYFETYRFSEDLDYTITDSSHIDHEFLIGVFRDIGEWIYEQTGIEIPEELREFEIFENPRGTVSCQGKLSYRGPIAPRSGGLPRIKLDPTPDELLVLTLCMARDRRGARRAGDLPDGCRRDGTPGSHTAPAGLWEGSVVS